MMYVLDASAIIAALKGESGGKVVSDLLADASDSCTIHVVNLCEVFYDLVRVMGLESAQSTIERVRRSGIMVREDMDTAFWQKAGLHKANIKRVSLADCFCMALADRLNAEIVTADRHELEAVRDQGLCRITFIR
jgi:PIN domain nuclease of toxin-antitoxin system